MLFSSTLNNSVTKVQKKLDDPLVIPFSPYINRFLSADTIVPGYANPQSLNRYSYVINNPLRYTDPTGHGQCQTKEDCEDMGTTPMGAGKSVVRPKRQHKDKDHDPTPIPSGDETMLTSGAPCVGAPGNAGSFYGGYCAGGGGLLQTGFGSVGGDGDCTGNVCSFTGGSVPIKYSASVDVLLYENLMIVELHENYWIPDHDLPLMENSTFGGSTLISQLSGGAQVETNLGSFISGNAAHPERLIHRDTQINYWGKPNFPTQLTIRLLFGAENRGVRTIYYQLPYQTPWVTLP